MISKGGVIEGENDDEDQTGFLLVLILLVGVAGTAAQEPGDSPEAIVQALVADGYLSTGEGKVAAESAQEVIDLTGKDNATSTVRFAGNGRYSDFVMGATVGWGPGAAEDWCSFVLRQDDSAGSYVVSISRDGNYHYVKARRGGQIADEVSRPAAALRTRTLDTNLLVVAVTGSTFQVFLNGEHVATFQDSEFTSGKAAVSMHTFQASNATSCTFSHVWLWRLSAVQTSVPPTAAAPEQPPASGRDLARATPTPRPTPRSLPSLTPPPPPTADSTVALTAYDQPADQAVAELERLGIIPSGGSQVFVEDYAYFTGTGSWFTMLASARPYTHIVVAGELTFRPGTMDDVEVCSLMSRIVMKGASPTDTFLEVGFTNSGELIAFDMVSGEAPGFGVQELDIDLSQPHHLLYTALGDTLTVYLDGERVIEDMQVSERSGTYGIALLGVGSNARCEGRNIWVYQVDDAVEFGGGCGVRAANTVNLRSGPGTTFAQAGQLLAGQSAVVTGQAGGADGTVWWQLEGGNWVRSDVVRAVGDCTDVPVVMP